METANRFSAFTWATYPVLNPVIMDFNLVPEPVRKPDTQLYLEPPVLNPVIMDFNPVPEPVQKPDTQLYLELVCRRTTVFQV